VIGIDTNVLVRYLTQDDPDQAQVVDDLIAKSIRESVVLHVDDVVLCELVWVLRGAYRFKKSTIATALDKILSTALFSFDDRDLLRQALDAYRDHGGDFADYAIGARNAKSGCDVTVTFDRGLRGSEGFLVLQSHPVS